MLEKTLENPLDCKEIQLVNSKENKSGILIGRTDAEAETPIFWPPDMKNWLIGKDPADGKDWKQKKGTTEEELVGWLHRLDGRGFESASGVGDGQGSLACCSPWGHEQSEMTERLNWLTDTLVHLGIFFFSYYLYQTYTRKRRERERKKRNNLRICKMKSEKQGIHT